MGIACGAAAAYQRIMPRPRGRRRICRLEHSEYSCGRNTASMLVGARHGRESSSTVRLIHYTLQEYLSYNPNLFLKPDSVIAEVCLTYLNYRHIRDFSPALRSAPPTVPCVEYASCYWGTHARRGSTESVKTLALKLLDEYGKHISSKILLLRGVSLWDQPFDSEDTPRGFTGLHGAAYHGCVEIAVALLKSNK